VWACACAGLPPRPDDRPLEHRAAFLGWIGEAPVLGTAVLEVVRPPSGEAEAVLTFADRERRPVRRCRLQPAEAEALLQAPGPGLPARCPNPWQAPLVPVAARPLAAGEGLRDGGRLQVRQEGPSAAPRFAVALAPEPGALPQAIAQLEAGRGAQAALALSPDGALAALILRWPGRETFLLLDLPRERRRAALGAAETALEEDRAQAALELLALAESLGPTPEAALLEARVRARRGERAEALQALARALDRGGPAWARRARAAADLAPLATEPAFEELLRRYGDRK
jgi:hypothetical protein